jgi:hypothetical protein
MRAKCYLGAPRAATGVHPLASAKSPQTNLEFFVASTPKSANVALSKPLIRQDRLPPGRVSRGRLLYVGDKLMLATLRDKLSSRDTVALADRA